MKKVSLERYYFVLNDGVLTLKMSKMVTRFVMKLFICTRHISNADLHETSGRLLYFSLQALTVIVKCFPSQIVKSMPAVLEAIWKTLTDSALTYVRTVIHDTEEADDPVDSDGK